ncbi:MAG TPA: hypothetical protein VNM68_08560 [Candidatus Polarisedimenticolia bacterium]|nr:hypothetical protein [Candidatus Polarisedimenticolia bacterium]
MNDRDANEHLSKEARDFIERKSRAAPSHPTEDREGTGRITTGNPGASASKTFAVRCEPPDQRHSLIASGGLCAFVGQRVRKNGLEQMWDSVIIQCDEQADGTLSVSVFVCDPGWDELLQIACIRSRPDDKENHAVLGCNLDHVSRPRIP